MADLGVDGGFGCLKGVSSFLFLFFLPLAGEGVFRRGCWVAFSPTCLVISTGSLGIFCLDIGLASGLGILAFSFREVGVFDL